MHSIVHGIDEALARMVSRWCGRMRWLHTLMLIVVRIDDGHAEDDRRGGCRLAALKGGHADGGDVCVYVLVVVV